MYSSNSLRFGQLKPSLNSFSLQQYPNIRFLLALLVSGKGQLSNSANGGYSLQQNSQHILGFPLKTSQQYLSIAQLAQQNQEHKFKSIQLDRFISRSFRIAESAHLFSNSDTMHHIFYETKYYEASSPVFHQIIHIILQTVFFLQFKNAGQLQRMADFQLLSAIYEFNRRLRAENYSKLDYFNQIYEQLFGQSLYSCLSIILKVTIALINEQPSLNEAQFLTKLNETLGRIGYRFKEEQTEGSLKQLKNNKFNKQYFQQDEINYKVIKKFVENEIHYIVIQPVLDQDLYQELKLQFSELVKSNKGQDYNIE